MKRFEAGANDAGTRLSRFVQRVTCGLPGSMMHKGFRNGRVKVNGRKAAPDYALAVGDVVELYLNDEFFHAPVENGPSAARGPLPPYHTVYQDAALAVLYKPAGVLSHRDTHGRPGMLDTFIAQLVADGTYDPAAENTFAPALCNRLDRGTEGLVLAAKTAQALRDGSEAIRLGLLEKIYLCVCVGRPPQGDHRAFLTRDRAAKTATISDAPAPGAKPIATGVRVLASHGGLSLCEIQLHTGRTHQIRAHLAALGAPLLGDRKYGGSRPGLPALEHQALCAWQLTFAVALPGGSCLRPLAGRSFTAGRWARLPAWWAHYTGQKPGL